MNSKRSKHWCALITGFFALFVVVVLSDGMDKTFYVKAKRIYTCDSNRIIEDGGFLIDGKKIIRVDKKVKPPKNARLIDLKDKIVIPGFIDSHSYFGFHEEDYSVRTEPAPPWRFAYSAYLRALSLREKKVLPPRIYAHYNASDAVFYRDASFTKPLSEGITTASISIPTEYLVGGVSFCAKLSANSPSEFIVLDPAGADFSLRVKENVMMRYGDLKKVFLEAIEYRRKFEKYKKDLKKYKESHRKEKNKDKKDITPQKETKEPKEPLKNEDHEVVLQILERKIPALIRASRIHEVQAAIKIRDEFKINVILVGAHEAYKVADEIALKKISVIAGPEAVQVIKGRKVNYIKELLEENVLVAFCSDSSASSAFLPFQLSYAIQHGLSEVEALNVLTINAARILGIANRTGSIAPGKDADFVVLNGKPFDLSTRVDKVYINGRMVYSNE
ncbi:MAG: amidohydrolase family protein [Candidatus Aminicenantes bacterium]|nr:MAG: amidohydrolase family protein [Candidatus Aminicenantes bacterium]